MSELRKMYHTLQEDPFPAELHLTVGDQELIFKKKVWQIAGQEKGLRYGENPDQPAAMYYPHQGQLELDGVPFKSKQSGLLSALQSQDILQSGKHPGKINLTDVDNGLNILQYLQAKPAAVILKHNNPCGAGWSDQGLQQAMQKAYFCDRIAAFGGAVVLNRELDQASAEFIQDSYFEVVAAPEFGPGTLETLKTRKNLRILRIPGLGDLERQLQYPFLDIKSLTDGGLIVQFSFRNRILAAEDFLPAQASSESETVAARQPTSREAQDLLFAWAVEAGVTSNSVIFARDGATVGIGTGEQDRVGCVELTIFKAYQKYADLLAFQETGLSLYQLRSQAKQDPDQKRILEDIQARTQQARGGLPGSVLVSDGFFPFRDGADLAIEQGVTAIAQPGGSMNDTEVIQAVNQADPQVAMVFTGQRSFKH
ncbi:MAG: IMP cyclohydrolase [Desulfohalobiaceae bacterium]